MIPGSKDIVVEVSAVEGAYGSQVPDRQFRYRSMSVVFISEQTQNNILYQSCGVGAGFGGKLRKLRFLFRCQMNFHRPRLPEKSATPQRKPAFFLCLLSHFHDFV